MPHLQKGEKCAIYKYTYHSWHSFHLFETFDGVLYAFGCLFQELHCKGIGSKLGFMRLRIGGSGGETMSLS